MTLHQRIAVVSADFASFKVGQRVMTVDGYPGVVSSVLDGPYAQTEAYDVVLDGGMGGGEYRVSDLSPYTASTAAKTVESELVEASSVHVASEDYPELSEILRDRLPNENIRYTASRKTADDKQGEPEDDRELTEDPEPYREEPLPIDPPDSCSFCGNDAFEDAQNTGRGTRMRCSQCQGTMTSWGGQWQPETPGSSQNQASDQSDYRSGGAAGVASLPGANFKTAANSGFSEYNRYAQDIDEGLRPQDRHKDITTHTGHNYRLLTNTDGLGGKNRVTVHKPLSNGKYQGVGYLSWFGGKPEEASGSNTDPGVIYKAHVADSHRRRGLASHMLDFAREKNPDLDIRHSNALTEDGKAWAEKKASLEDHGLRFHLTASWRDVREKAKRLRHEGLVTITGATHSAILGEVTGDTAVYESELKYLPGGRKVASWYCGCAWGSYANEPRFGQFKRFQNRLCSHALALQFEAQSQGMFGKTVNAALGDNPEGQFEPSDQSFDLDKLKQMIPHPSGSDMVGLAEEAAPLAAAASIMDPDGIYATEVDLFNPPIYAHAQMLNESGINPVEAIHTLTSLGATRKMAQTLIYQAVQEATADADGGQGIDAKAPRQEDRDKSDLEKKKDNHLHHTNDAREHAHNYGWGIPWYLQGNLGTCTQCSGSGCGHCGGSGQVQTGDVPAIGDASADAGDMSNGISAAGMVHESEIEGYNVLPGGVDTQGPWKARDPHSDSVNPASTGWATGQDPKNWTHGWLPRNFGESYSASVHADKEDDSPSVSGVALHAKDTGRVLMIQRSHSDETDPAKGTWEFPGGHHEDGDKTSLHAGIREWEEEVGQPFPEGGTVKGTHISGPYALHKVEIPEEKSVDFSGGRSTVNPDDPDGDDHEQAAWWDPKHAEENPALRKELKKPKVWDHVRNATLLDEPEPALPSTEGADESEEDIVKRFQATAGAAAIADIPELRRTAMKTFDHAEQQSLINEGLLEKARTRNFGDLKIADTHYALLSEDDPDDLESVW